jgi:hypothetical protein
VKILGYLILILHILTYHTERILTTTAPSYMGAVVVFTVGPVSIFIEMQTIY